MFGCGGSQSSGSAEDWSAQSRVADVIALADEVGAARFSVVGESYGGTIALMTGLAAPERIESLAICNAAHIGSSIQSVGMWEQMLIDDGVQGWSDHMMGQRFFVDSLSVEMREWYSKQQASHSQESILKILHALVAVDITEGISDLEVPVLLLHGDSSPFIPVSIMADLHKRLADSEMHVFSHARHGLPFSHARECAAVLGSFLNRKLLPRVESLADQ